MGGVLSVSCMNRGAFFVFTFLIFVICLCDDDDDDDDDNNLCEYCDNDLVVDFNVLKVILLLLKTINDVVIITIDSNTRRIFDDIVVDFISILLVIFTINTIITLIILSSSITIVITSRVVTNRLSAAILAIFTIVLQFVAITISKSKSTNKLNS